MELLAVLVGGVITLDATLLTQWFQWKHERQLRAEERQREREERRQAELLALDREGIAQIEAYCDLISNFTTMASNGVPDAVQLYLTSTTHHFKAMAAACQRDEKALKDAISEMSFRAAQLADAMRNGQWRSISSDPKMVDAIREPLVTATNYLLAAKLKVIKSL